MNWKGPSEKCCNQTVKSQRQEVGGAKKPKKENIDNSKKKQLITFKETHIRFISTLFCRNIKSRREWDDIFKVLKVKTYQLRWLYSANCPSHEGEIKTFPDEQKLKEFITTKLPIRIVKGSFSSWKEKNSRQQHRASQRIKFSGKVNI